VSGARDDLAAPAKVVPADAHVRAGLDERKEECVMSKVNFKGIADVQAFEPLPKGTYQCKVEEVEESVTQYGDEMWNLRLVVTGGPHEGRLIFDRIVFSDAALERAKLFCYCLGLDVSGELDLTPDLIRGRTCGVRVKIEKYEDNERRTRLRNVVPFAGYEPRDDALVSATPDQPRLPF
jgi:hypothetical protein